MYHLHEAVFESSLLWMKIQTSGTSEDQVIPFLEARFGGTVPNPCQHSFDAPFRLSERSHRINNWDDIKDQLPVGWDDHEFRLVEGPYPWCETLSEDCDCHGRKGRLDVAYCSGFGLLEEISERTSRTQNVWHLNYIRGLEENVARSDRLRREEKLNEEGHASRQRGSPVAAEYVETGGVCEGTTSALSRRVNEVVSQGFYCSIEERHHPFSDRAKQNLATYLSGLFAQLATMSGDHRETVMRNIGAIVEWQLKMHQSRECGERLVWGNTDIPDLLYKYIPKERIGNGAPDTLRATQLLALNDDMECNVVTMRGDDQLDTLPFLALVRSKLEEHLSIAVPKEELLKRSLRYGDLRLSTFIQENLNPRVGVVSFSTDFLVPTMWSHYARNTGIVVGYDTAVLRSMGFELRPVIYSENAPTYQPSKNATIQLSFVDREDMAQRARRGETSEGWPIMAEADLAEMDGGWKSLSRLLFVKGMSWAYEREVRLLVDLEQTRDTGKEDSNGYPIKVLDIPPEAIKKIYRVAHTPDADVERAIKVGRGENRKGLYVGRVSSHAFRMQKTVGMQY